MPVAISQINDKVTRVALSGRIDVAGAMEIDMPMSVVGGSRTAVVIDLAAVEFLASLGLRSLVTCAKAILNKRGKVVLLGPRRAVEEVLTVSGVDGLIPIYHDEMAAVAAVTPSFG